MTGCDCRCSQRVRRCRTKQNHLSVLVKIFTITGLRILGAFRKARLQPSRFNAPTSGRPGGSPGSPSRKLLTVDIIDERFCVVLAQLRRLRQQVLLTQQRFMHHTGRSSAKTLLACSSISRSASAAGCASMRASRQMASIRARWRAMTINPPAGNRVGRRRMRLPS